MIMMISKFYLKQKILGGKLPLMGGGILGGGGVYWGGILGGGAEMGVVWELCVRPSIYERFLFT